MKTIVVVVVYDRIQNIQEWARCWNLCETQNAQLVCIHNAENETAEAAYRAFCAQVGIHYISRINVGFDIGACQDVILDRLEGFPTDFDNIIWVTDDTLPMRKDFIHTFTSALSDEVVVSCMELPPTQNNHSVRAKMHIRTTGFCMSKEWFYKLKFTVDPIVTKQDCFKFEHEGNQTFLDQVQSWGKKAIQVTDINVSPLWDMGRIRQAKRVKEHYNLFPKPEQSSKKVTFICLVYNQFPNVIADLINQTHQAWELILIHDGVNTTGIAKLVAFINDPRIKFIERPVRVRNFGHPHRAWAINELKEGRLSTESDYIVVTNADNNLFPAFCEYMVKGFEDNPNAVGVYCDQMVHSYLRWQIINCKLQQGYIDCSGMMIRRSAACKVGWRDITSHSSDWYFFNDLINHYGKDRFIPVKGCLFSHN